MKKHLTHLLFAMIVVAALLLSACGGSETAGPVATEPPASNVLQPTPLAPPPGGLTVSKDILLDPANATDADSLLLIGYVYEGLFKVQGSDVLPVLATSYTVSNDGLDYIINLRPNVTFHDGSPLNADAVIANFERWFDPKHPAHKGDFTAWADLFGGFKGETTDSGISKSTFDGAEKVDDLTVLIHLTEPDSQFIVKLNNPAFYIVSPAAFEADYFGSSLGKAAGTGTYTIDAWTDAGLTLKPFASYWSGVVATAIMEFKFK
jgi:peptide/nickel transport system substrate-binding protein